MTKMSRCQRLSTEVKSTAKLQDYVMLINEDPNAAAKCRINSLSVMFNSLSVMFNNLSVMFNNLSVMFI